MGLPITVTISPAVRVPPASVTPKEILPLSSIDRYNIGRITVDAVSVFTHGVQAAACIRDAIAKALVHYNPVAGKIIEIKPGEPEVDCTGEGIWFVEATANCSLEEVNYLEDWPLMIPREQLLPQTPPEAKLQDEILMVQVTEFTCGGFIIGFRVSHLVFDGIGFAQFLQAVCEMARGVSEPTVKPVWFRENIPDPPKVAYTIAATGFNFTTSVVDISLESINRTKDLYMAETGQRCSTFDVVTAMIFKCRARAIDLVPEAMVRLACAANTRHLLSSILPYIEGYYGNCLYPLFITKSSEEMNNSSLVDAINLIKGAKESHSTKFLNWMHGHTTESIQNMPLDYGSMVVADWSMVGLNEVDFGWGPRRYIVPLNDNLSIALATYVKPPPPKTGIRLFLRCVKEEHSAVFCQELSMLA